MQPRVSAIVPAYNENGRIRPVVDALRACPSISEIIVVDDGSASPIDAPHPIRVIRHERNRGKAAALESGIVSSSGEYLFFCDADLVGFGPKDAEEMIRPVIAGECDMSIGLRRNLAQRLVFLFALNSGERCLRRSDWMALDSFYKRGFRVETGLNIGVWLRGGTIFHKQFGYEQTLREKKYGLLRGMAGHIKIATDVAIAWGYAFASLRNYRKAAKIFL